MKTIVNTILFLISDANSLKVPKNLMFYDFRIVAGACGGQWREAPELHKRAPGRRGAKSDKFITRKALF